MVNLHVGFTGTQHGMTPAQAAAVRSILWNLKPTYGHHGVCIGSDEQFHRICRDELDLQVFGHPPVDTKKMAQLQPFEFYFMYPPQQYITRNHKIVSGSKVMIATPREYNEQLRSGTWATIRQCHRVRRQLHLVWPNGNITNYIY